MNDDEKKKIGEKVRQARVLAKLTQDSLAKMVGLERVSISRTEMGQREVGATELKRIASATGRPLGFFYMEENGSTDFTGVTLTEDIRDLSDLSPEDKKLVDGVIDLVRSLRNK